MVHCSWPKAHNSCLKARGSKLMGERRCEPGRIQHFSKCISKVPKMSEGRLGTFRNEYLTNSLQHVFVSRFLKCLESPFSLKFASLARCAPQVFYSMGCVCNSCSWIIKWYLMDIHWPFFVCIVSVYRTLLQPLFEVWFVNHRCLMGCCSRLFQHNVSNPSCSSFS